MNIYPSRTDIITAMQNPVCLKAKELKGGRVLIKNNRVVQYSGGYTIVFPFWLANGEKRAVRLWIADIGNAKKRLLKISECLKKMNSDYFVDFRYIDDAVLVNGVCRPVVLMEWVEGLTLKEYLNKNIMNSSLILELAAKFEKMVRYFHSCEIAHGDLQHGNILVDKDHSLFVIDYDSMYVPSLTGMPDIIKGLPGYQHPSRNLNKQLSSVLDYFSELVIYLSLLVYARMPNLWPKFYLTEDLLFSKEDFLNPTSSELINQFKLSEDYTIRALTEILVGFLNEKNINSLLPLELLLKKNEGINVEKISDMWNANSTRAIDKKVDEISEIW